jgi:hypothetical protein
MSDLCHNGMLYRIFIALLVITYASQGEETYGLVQSISPRNVIPDDIFRVQSISVSPNRKTMVIGEFDDNEFGEMAGAIHILELKNDKYEYVQKVLPDLRIELGYYVHADSEGRIFASSRTRGYSTGDGKRKFEQYIYIYRKNPISGKWAMSSVLVNNNPAGTFGMAIVSNNDDIYVSDPSFSYGMHTFSIGIVYHFKEMGTPESSVNINQERTFSRLVDTIESPTYLAPNDTIIPGVDRTFKSIQEMSPATFGQKIKKIGEYLLITAPQGKREIRGSSLIKGMVHVYKILPNGHLKYTTYLKAPFEVVSDPRFENFGQNIYIEKNSIYVRHSINRNLGSRYIFQNDEFKYVDEITLLNDSFYRLYPGFPTCYSLLRTPIRVRS